MPNKTLTLSVRVHIKLQDIEYLLDSASRGSEYWCENAHDLAYESTTKQIVQEGKTWRMVDAEDDGKIHSLNLQTIKKGLTVMAKKEPHHFADFLQEQGDMNTGDVFLQCCLFGEVRYS